MTTAEIASRIRTMSQFGQPVRVSRKAQHPVGIEQLLLKDGQPAYYTEAEWPGNSHLLKDHREGVGDLRMPRSGRCVLLDGVDDVGVHPVAGLPGDLTIATRLKTSNWSGSLAARTTASQYFARFTSSSSILIFNGSSVTTLSFSALPLNEWVHFALTRAGSTWRAYINGVEQANTVTLTGDMSVQYINGNPRFAGRYKDYIVYNTALTPAQVRALRNGDYHGSPVLDLPLEEESGYISFDRSGNGNHVTWSGITPSTFHAVDPTVPTSRANEMGYSARINGVRYSEDLTNAAWLKRNGATVTSVAVTGPNGQPTSNRLQTPSNGSTFEDVYQFFSGFTSGASLDVRFYLQDNGSTRRNLGVANRSSSDYGSWIIDLDALDPGWNLITDEHPAVNVVKAFVATSPSLGFGDVNFPFSGDAHDVLIHEVQVTEKTYGGGYVKTTNEAFLGAIQPALNDTADALGNALQYTGPAPNPGKYLAPVLTGNGTDVVANCGQTLIPATAAWSFKYWFYLDTLSDQIILGQQAGGANVLYLAANWPGDLNSLALNAAGAVLTLNNALVVGSWHLIEASRSGGTLTMSCTPIGGTTVTGSIASSGVIGAASTRLLASSTTGLPSSGRAGLLEVTTGGVTKYVLPRAQTRTLDILGDDGSAATGTISGGTLSAIYANRCDGSWKDPRVEYGGQVRSFTIHDSIGSYNGTLLGFDDAGPTYSSDVPAALGSGYSLGFDGANDRCVNGTTPPTTSLGAIGVWIKGTTGGCIFSAWSTSSTSRYLSVFANVDTGTTGKIKFRYRNGVAGSIENFDSNAVPGLMDGNWHFVVLAADGTDYFVWVDNLSVGINNISAAPLTGRWIAALDTLSTMEMGSHQGSASFFEGWLDDFRLYGNALSGSQVSELYAGGEATGATLLVHWPINDISGESGDDRIILPTKLDDSAYADGSAIDIAAESHVPAQKLGDPFAAVDRTATNANTTFANDSGAPTVETVVTDVKTDTGSKARSRKTGPYKDRLGTSRNAQTRQLAEQYYGD